jgi:radical SAM protein with 4Fe4S-binding SPASM domain
MELKYFNLLNNVYIVDGAKFSAIYDLNRNILFHINNATRDLIYRLVLQPDLQQLKSEDEKIIDVLLANNLLKRSVVAGKINDIRALKLNLLPQFAWIEVTRQCNLSCIFCYEQSNATCSEFMTFDDYKLAIKNLKESGIKKIQFIGGEPLLIGDVLKRMIMFCRNDFATVEVFSNGVMIDNSWCQFFKDNNVSVALSVHSYIPEEHDKIVRSSGAHNKVMSALQLLQQYAIKYRIATIRNRSCNVGKPSAHSICKLHPAVPKLTGRTRLADFNFEMFVAKAITKDTFRRELNKTQIGIIIGGHRCLQKNFYISSDLTVYPCVMERRYDYGNLRNRTLSEMINDPRRFLSKDDIEGCQDCEYRYACFYCRPDTNGEGVRQKPWYCSYNPQSGEWQDLKSMAAKLGLRNNDVK